RRGFAAGLSRLITLPLQFLAFTGTVYAVGRYLFGGTGEYREVAYTFALFFVPLSILSSVLGSVVYGIPLLGDMAGWLMTLIQLAYAYVAVQSSMNVRAGVAPVAALLLAALVTSAFNLALYW
ncbi:YIP1 family protein, partial [Deinococcus lacus]